MKEIYLIRHGETAYNKAGIVQGSGVNLGLNETGQQQAAAFHRHYKEFPFDKVYVSALKRAQETVQPFMEKIPFEVLPELNEISWGVFEGRPEIEGWKGYYNNMVQQWASGNLDYKIEGGESPNELAVRQRKALTHILSRTEEQKVLICMHGRVLKSFLCLMLNLDLSRMDEFSHRNLCLYQLNYNGNGCELIRNNDISHLDIPSAH